VTNRGSQTWNEERLRDTGLRGNKFQITNFSICPKKSRVKGDYRGKGKTTKGTEGAKKNPIGVREAAKDSAAWNNTAQVFDFRAKDADGILH